MSAPDGREPSQHPDDAAAVAAAAADVAAPASAPVSAAGGLSQVASERFSMAQAVGGPRGVFEAAAPGTVFVVVFTATQQLTPSLVGALSVAAATFLLRVVTRSNPTQALSGVLGVVICALFARATGEARDYYAPGFFINVGYAAALAASTLPWRSFRVGRWRIPAGPFPVVGLVVGPLVGEGTAWRHDPARLRVYRRATWLLVGLFVLRLVVQLPLYLADAVEALGVARIVMGVPLFALVLWVVWRMLATVPRTDPDAVGADPVDGR